MKEPVWRRWLRLRGPDPRADVEEEFALHLEQRVEDLVARGLSDAEARRVAVGRFGDLEGAAAVCSEMAERRIRTGRREAWRAALGHDLLAAVKALRRSPGFTVAAVATIGLGVGANVIVAGLLRALLLQPLDAARPHELVRVYTSESQVRNERDRFGGSSYADYLELRQSRGLAGLAAFMPVAANVQLNGSVHRAEGRLVSDNYFAMLERPLLLGGWSPTGSQDVVISHRFWTAALARDPGVIGHPLLVNGQALVVGGVTAAGSRGIELAEVDLYLPFAIAPVMFGRPGMLSDHGQRSVSLLGRLAPGVTPHGAEESLARVMEGLGAEFPLTNAGRVMSVRRARSLIPMELMGSAVIPVAGLVFGATLVMLVIAGVNLAGVLLARTIRRRRELAVRLSLGASHGRLVRQLLSETIVLAAGAGLAVTMLIALLPFGAAGVGLPAAARPAADWSLAGYGLGLALLAGLIFGIVPALTALRGEVLDALRSGANDARPARARAQSALVVAQLALSLSLLLVSGALLGSLARQLRVDPGFAAERLLVAQFEDPTGRQDPGREQAFARLALERLAALPGVTAVSVASLAPFTSEGARSSIHIPDYVAEPEEDMEIAAMTAGPDYFRTLGIPLLRGRERTAPGSDSASQVVVNQSMARRYWGDRDPVGSVVLLGGRDGRPAEVIGVAADARFRALAEPPRPMYVIQRGAGEGGTVLIRTEGDPGRMGPAVRGVMSRADVPFTLVRLRTMDEIVQGSLAAARAVSRTLLAMGLLAITLAAVGLSGVVAYVAAGRTREFGVRLALGATPAAITRLVLGYGARLVLLGGGAGLLLGVGALRLIDRLLFGSWASAPAGIALGLLLGGLTLAACALPALRATSQAPLAALRVE